MMRRIFGFNILIFLILFASKAQVEGRRKKVPSAPLNLRVELADGNTVRLNWDPPLSPNGHIKGYYVYKEKLLNGAPVQDKLHKVAAIQDAQKTEFVVERLDPNTEYVFRVNAFNRHGDGEFSESQPIVTGGIPPPPPQIVSVSVEPKDPDGFPVKAKISWAPHDQKSPHESPIDRYILWYRPEGKDFRKIIVNGTQTEAWLNGLWLGRTYEIIICAENEEGSSFNITERLVTPVGVPDAEPSGVHYEVVDGKMRISWEPPAEERRNGEITSYRAILTPMHSDGQPIEKTVAGSDKAAVFSVEPRKSYTFKVAAATMKGYGPYSPVLTINPDPAALVGPPTNVRVQATSNSSAVVEWDFEGEQVDGFVVKYIHEPRGTKDTERWTARTVMSPSSRHLEIGQLTAHKPYAFCVLAIRQNRQGSCSDPPATISQLTPLYMVRNLHVKWKTSNSVMLAWEYDSPGRITGFYLNHTGKKEYMDQQLAVKTMFTPGFKHDTDSATREYLWINLRPFMRYTFTVGVHGEQNKQFWPKEVIVSTDPTGPPLVNAPRIDNPPEWVKPGQLSITPTPASEEYGPISHYWIVVIPGNVSYEHVVNMEPRDMELATTEKRAQLARMISAQPTKKVKKSVRFSDDVLTHEYPSSYPRKRRALSSHTDGVYITAKIGAETMRSIHSAGGKFIIGDEKVYDGFTNYPIEAGQKYRLMTRAFAAEQKTNKWEHRPPMSEKTLKMYTDSSPTEMFMSSSAFTKSKAATGMWFIGPAVALFVIAIIVFMLVCWWLRCSRKRLPHTHRHGSITKVALGGPINGIPSETSKLLPNESYSQSQRIINPYDQMNGQMESAMDDYGMTMQSHTNGTIRKGDHAYAPLPIHTSLLPNLGATNTISHPPIPISQLAPHIERLRGNNNLGFQQEFESIETGQHFTWEHSNSEYNKHKNRYANVVAYDHSRVMLCPLDGMPGSDYINANYIDGYEKPKAYIATQGPLPETFDAFWRMVWEEGTAMIVMLTNLEERSRVKCDQYWPSRGSVTYGEIQVTLLETTIFAHYTSRTFRIQALGEPLIREVRQLQYTAWPDHGVPDHPTPFLVFLKRVRTLNPPDAGPILSHCSAGIGRTGAFIVIDIMLERLRYENTVDIYGCVTNLRGQRSYMVQTEDQYIFIHDAVLDAVNSGSTEVPANRLYQHVQALSHTQNLEVGSGIDIEFRHLSTMKTTTARCGVASLGCNRHKNRQLAPVPFDNNRMILQMFPGVEGSDYINASWIDGYRERNAYIGTQGPIQATVEDFWRMIWESEAAIIVMLCKTVECNREWSFEYWPQDQGVQIGGVIVEPVAEYNMPQYILREFRISDPQSTVSRTVRHFQYVEWPEQGVPRTADTFLDFIQQVHRTKAQFGVVGPVVVHCGGGAIRSGVFISLALLIDRIHEEHVVDVFTTVKLLRTERSNMVGDKEHYHFLYQAVVEYLSSYDQSAFS